MHSFARCDLGQQLVQTIPSRISKGNHHFFVEKSDIPEFIVLKLLPMFTIDAEKF